MKMDAYIARRYFCCNSRRDRR